MAIVRTRVWAVLVQLGLGTPERLETVLALLDDRAPNANARLARLGFRFSAGATTRQILDAIAPRLGKGRMDRELRDTIMLPLREVGILRTGYAAPGAGGVIRDYWKPKSPHNLYVLDDDFRRLLTLPERDFEERRAPWQAGTAERVMRIASAEGAAFAAAGGDRLVPGTIALYCGHFLPGYQVVYVDDTDGRRIGREWEEQVRRLRLPLNLGTRWPDVILHRRETDRFWIVDCVETDGEIDAVRKRELGEAFAAEGLRIDGFTTAYRTASRFAQRQRAVDNIAADTYVWIMELGGAHFLKQPPRDPP